MADLAAAQPEEGKPGEEEEYFVDDEAVELVAPKDVVIMTCILNQGGPVLQGRRIWRKLAIPADFSLLELHVALQNAFDWEDTHLHDFSQPVTLGGVSVPPFPGHGPTDVAALAQQMLDIDSLPPAEVRTFRPVVGVKDETTEDLILTRAEEVGKEGQDTEMKDTGAEKKAAEKPTVHCLVYVEHSHPHAEPEKVPRTENLTHGPEQVLEERAFIVGDVLTSQHPMLVYEYDFQMGYEVHLFFEGTFKQVEGVNYPTCLAGSGSSPAEDGDDLDEEGNLKDSYDYSDFAVLDVLANFEKTFEDSWPLGPGAHDKTSLSRCYLCRYNRECGRRRECNGKCCDYCYKSPLVAEAGRLPLTSALSIFEAAAARIKAARKSWAEGGKCEWTEDDGAPCAVCPE